MAGFKRRNRYGSVGVRVDGRYFASKKEARYWGELKMRLLSGELKEVQVQPEFDLTVNGVHICKHRLDFKVTYADGRVEYIDVKSAGTERDEINRLKKRLLLALHGIECAIKC